MSFTQTKHRQTNDFCFRSRHHFIFSSIWDFIWTKHVRWDQTKQTHLAFAKVLLSCYRTKAYLTRCVLNFLRGKDGLFKSVNIIFLNVLLLGLMPPRNFGGPMETMSVFVHLVIQMPLNELDGKGKCYAVLCNCSSVQKVMKILSFFECSWLWKSIVIML